MTYEEIILKIQTCSITDENEFDLFIDEIAVEVEELNLTITQKEYLIEKLLFNIEGQPEPEFTSWSMLHFMEGLDEDNSTNYNIQILRSLKKKPKVMTLLLTNRIINVLPELSEDRILFLSALQEVASNNAFDDYVRNEANEFYKYQMSNNSKY